MKKKVLAIITAVHMILGAGGILPAVSGDLGLLIHASAISFEDYYEGYYYDYLDDGTIRITKYNGTNEELILPNEIDGRKVTRIGNYAFNSHTNLTSITMPNSITSIGDYAFSGCTNLKNITISDNVTSIRDHTFDGCISLASITIPDSVANIADSAFFNCKSLKSVNLPDSVTSIGYFAFSGCENLESVTLPDSVMRIWSDAFSGCKSLKSITIPDSLSNIGSSVFSGCTSLASVTIPDSFTSISLYTFHGCTSLTSINIPDSVKSIEIGAFYGCTSLTNIAIPEKVTSIGRAAFSNTKWLEIKQNENPMVIVNKILIDGTKCTGDIVIPDSVKYIGDEAFYGCTKLTSVTLPDSVASIGISAFFNCTGLKSITIPESVVKIDIYAFGYIEKVGFERIRDFKIYCYKDSAGEKYANQNGFEYVLLKKTHKITDCTITLNQTSYTYDGTEKKPTVTANDGTKTLVNGTDFTVSYSNNKNVGTAEVIVTGIGKYSGTTSLTFEIVAKVESMLGDVNGDGKLNVTDITKVAAHIKGKKMLDDAVLQYADVNHDGKINVSDITKIAAHIKGKKLLF